MKKYNPTKPFYIVYLVIVLIYFWFGILFSHSSELYMITITFMVIPTIIVFIWTTIASIIIHDTLSSPPPKPLNLSLHMVILLVGTVIMYIMGKPPVRNVVIYYGGVLFVQHFVCFLIITYYNQKKYLNRSL